MADDCLDVVRIDLGRFALRGATAHHEGRARGLPAWLDAHAAIAGTNAGMFGDDQRSVGLLITGDEVNRGRDNPKFGGFLAWDPVDPADPPAQVFGRDCDGFDLAALRRRYRGLAQSYRLLGCDGAAIAWADPKSYSAAAIGVSRDGRLALLHARAPHVMSELARTVATLDLGGAIFVEGGPEATLVVRGRDGEVVRIGSFETGFVENDGNRVEWDLPNILGVERIGP